MASAFPRQAVIERLDALFAPFDRSDAPGGAVAVRWGGSMVYRRGFGLTTPGAGVVNRPSTRFPVGSVAKPMTCAALLLLQAERKLALEDALGRWLPELPQSQWSPTLAQVMRHQGGVRCYLDQWLFDGYRTLARGRPWSMQSRQQSLNFAPGSRSAYSNGGYLLLTRVIERASGRDFADFVNERLLGPAGLYASAFPRDATIVSFDLASPCTPAADRGWRPALWMMEDAHGEGGLVASADDLLRWAVILRETEGPVGLAALLAPGEPAASGPSDYRFGLIAQEWRGLRLAHHGGGLPGANSVLAMAVDETLDVAILFNRPAPASRLVFEVLELLLGDRLPPPVPPPQADDYADLLGTWVSREDGLLFAFVDDGGRLALSLFGDDPMPLETCGADDGALPFWADAGAAQMRFRRESGALDWFDGKAWSRAERLPSGPAAEDEVLDFAAHVFRSTEVRAALRLEREGDALRLVIEGSAGAISCPAETVASDLLRFRPPPFSTGKLARLSRGPNGEPMRIVVSTSRTRGIAFTRVDARPPSERP